MKTYSPIKIYATTYALSYIFSHNLARYIKARIQHPEWFKKSKIAPQKAENKAMTNTICTPNKGLLQLMRGTALVVLVTPIMLLFCSPTSGTINIVIALIAASAVTSIVYEIYTAVKRDKKYPRYGYNHNEESAR